MPTVDDTIRRLLPDGTRDVGQKAWTECPLWPPDAFAVAATLVSQSACYARFHVGESNPTAYRDEVTSAGKEWRLMWNEARTDENRPTGVPEKVQSYWSALQASAASNVSEEPNEEAPPAPWWEAAMKLLAAADEASGGVGFHENKEVPSFIADWVLFARSGGATKNWRDVLLREKRSICRLVPIYEACVQPKAVTAQVGCTLRSLTHHLALLPAAGEAGAEWWISPLPRKEQLNLLLVPLPFRIPSSAFRAEKPKMRTGNYFSVSPEAWLPDARSRVAELTTFLVTLVKQVEAQGGAVNGIVLPELALDFKTAQEVANNLNNAFLGTMDLFITGVVDGRYNAAYTAVLGTKGALYEWTQRKHHRWRLDAGQICRYGLAHVLDPGKTWWEDTELHERLVKTVVFHEGGALNVLVCEDLARIDPAQIFLRSLGPNLIIALLLDGPQLEYRWPGQCATVLADDPGSSVLTLTSLGMLRRADASDRETGAKKGSDPREWNIALWKEAGKRARPLRLRDGAHGLLLTLSFAHEEQRTLDRRTDHGVTLRVSFAQSRQVVHPSPPDWVKWGRSSV